MKKRAHTELRERVADLYIAKLDYMYCRGLDKYTRKQLEMIEAFLLMLPHPKTREPSAAWAWEDFPYRENVVKNREAFFGFADAFPIRYAKIKVVG